MSIRNALKRTINLNSAILSNFNNFDTNFRSRESETNVTWPKYMAHNTWGKRRLYDLAEFLICCRFFHSEKRLNYPQDEIRPA